MVNTLRKSFISILLLSMASHALSQFSFDIQNADSFIFDANLQVRINSSINIQEDLFMDVDVSFNDSNQISLYNYPVKINKGFNEYVISLPGPEKLFTDQEKAYLKHFSSMPFGYYRISLALYKKGDVILGHFEKNTFVTKPNFFRNIQLFTDKSDVLIRWDHLMEKPTDSISFRVDIISHPHKRSFYTENDSLIRIKKKHFRHGKESAISIISCWSEFEISGSESIRFKRKELLSQKELAKVMPELSIEDFREIDTPQFDTNLSNIYSRNLDFLKKNKNLPGIPDMKARAVEFHGSLIIEGQYSNREYLSEYIPPQYARVHFCPEVSVYGIPFNSKFFLTTENNASYNMNFFSLSFDKPAFNEIIRLKALKDINRNKMESLEQFNQLDLLDKKYQFMTKDYLNNVRGLDSLYQFGNYGKIMDTTGVANPNIQIPDTLSYPDSLDFVNYEFEKAYRDKLAGLRKNYLDQQDSLDRIRQLSINKIYELEQTDSLLNMAVNHPEKLQQYADLIDIDERYIRVFSLIDQLKLGLNAPHYSTFTIHGLSVKGMNLEMHPKKFYFASMYGRINNTYHFQDYGRIESMGDIYGLRFGIGNKYDDHLILSFIQGAKTDIRQVYSGSQPGQTDNIHNSVFSLCAAQEFFNLFTLKGELANSAVFQGNGNAPNLSPMQVFHKNNMAYELDLHISLPFRASLAYNRKNIGPNFSTPGNPFLINDQFTEEAKYKQGFLKNRVVTTLSYKTMTFNESETRAASTEFVSYSANLTLKFRKLPVVTISYVPYYYTNNILLFSDSGSYIAKNSSLMINLFYQVRKKNATYLTQANYMKNRIYNFVDQKYLEYSSVFVMETFEISKNLSFDLGANYFYASEEKDSLNKLYINCGISFRLRGKWKHNLSMNLNTLNPDISDMGIRYSSELGIAKNVNMILSFEKLNNQYIYNHPENMEYRRIPEQEYIINAMFSYNW